MKMMLRVYFARKNLATLLQARLGYVALSVKIGLTPNVQGPRIQITFVTFVFNDVRQLVMHFVSEHRGLLFYSFFFFASFVHIYDLSRLRF